MDILMTPDSPSSVSTLKGNSDVKRFYRIDPFQMRKNKKLRKHIFGAKIFRGKRGANFYLDTKFTQCSQRGRKT